MAELELSVLTRQALRRRIASLATLKRQTHEWMRQRNQNGATVDWRFTTDDARIKLKRLYPSLQMS